MVSFTQSEYLAHESRVKKRTWVSEKEPVGVELESTLHTKIIDHCNAQWPRWKAVYARMDKKSTLPEGCHDLTIFAKFPLCFLVEAKARSEKPSIAQRDWIHEMKMLGWTVHVIRNYEQFLEIVR